MNKRGAVLISLILVVFLGALGIVSQLQGFVGKITGNVITAQGNDAQFVSQATQLTVPINHGLLVFISMKNTGNRDWTSTDNFCLGSQNPQDNYIWGLGRTCINPGEVIKPGQTKTFIFGVTAPSVPGEYNFQWRMLNENVEWFGDYTPNLKIKVVDYAGAKLDAQFVSQDVPVNVSPGQQFLVNIIMKNNGSRDWTQEDNFKLGSQNPQDNLIWRWGRVNLNPGEVIKPGQTKTFQVTLTAPSQVGEYNFQWRMLQEYVEWFGEYSPNVKIAVSSVEPPIIIEPPLLTVTPMSNAIELYSPRLVSENKCYYIDYTNPQGVRKLTYLNDLPMIPWGADKMHICLPKDISSNFKLKSTTINFEQSVSLGSGSEAGCSDFVTNVYNYPNLFALAGNFDSSPLTVSINPVGSTDKTNFVNTNPQALYRNTLVPAYNYGDDYNEADKRILLIFEKPDSYAANYEINVSQGDRKIWMGVPNWNCPTINEPDPELGVWTELRNESQDPKNTLYESPKLEEINWDLINSAKFKSDMQALHDAGINTLTVNPQTSMWDSCLATVLPKYNTLVSGLNGALNGGSFKFILEPNQFLNVNYLTGEYFPNTLAAWDLSSNVQGQQGWEAQYYYDWWDIFHTNPRPTGWSSKPKNDKEAFSDLYACLSRNLIGSDSFKGVMPWQEATSRHYIKSIQTEVIGAMRAALSGSDKSVYGFDGWVEDNTPTGNMETNYLVTDFGDIMVHQSFPAGGKVLPNGASAIQDTADGLRFWFRGLWRQGRTTPVKVITYLQAFDKGNITSCAGMSFKEPSVLAQNGFVNNWKMKNELDAQKAAIKFYSDKYNIPATFYGAMFYYYGNYLGNAGKDYTWLNESTSDKPTDCWPRIDNNQAIFNEVIDTAKYVRDQSRVNVA